MTSQADEWWIHRHTLTAGAENEVLMGRTPKLRLTSEGGAFRAEFDLHAGPDPIVLRQRRIDVGSYVGCGWQHYCRIVPIYDPAQGLEALFGHVSATDSYSVRDLFIGLRQERRLTPVIPAQGYTFPGPTLIPLQDHLPHCRGEEITLTLKEIRVGKNRYELELKELPKGGLEFRASGEGRIGGLVLLDERREKPLLACFEHLHSQHRHVRGAEARAGGQESPVGDVPGHPICTNLYAAYALP